MTTEPRATIYIRKDGRFAARCDGTHDTGYEYNGGPTLCRNVTRDEAEACIAHDWRHP
jgi:hypothetical protein